MGRVFETAPRLGALSSWLPKVKIQGKLTLGFAVQLALLAGVAAIGLIGLRAVQSSFRSAIDGGLRIERLAGEMQKELLEARGAEREFLFYWRAHGEDATALQFVEINRKHVNTIRALVTELDAEEPRSGHGGFQGRIREDLISFKPYVEVYAQDFEAAVALASQTRASRGNSVRQIDAKIDGFHAAAIIIEPLVADIASSGRADAAAEIEAAESTARRTALSVGAIFLAAILTGVGFAYVLGRQVRTPLRSLALAAEAVGAGDLTVQASVESEDEIGTLAATFNSMTYRLRGLIDSLEQRVLERKRAEADLRSSQEALRENQVLLQSIIEHSGAVIYVKDLEGRYLLVNRRFEELFHVERQAILGKTDHLLFAPEFADVFQSNDQQAIAAGQPWESEEVVPQDDGVHVYLSIKCPLAGTDGRPYAVCGISADITERKRVEHQLRQSQKMDAIGRLAGGIAHDFNNLLTAINGYSGLALMRLDSSNELHGVLLQILKAGERAAELTKQLLTYSRKQTQETKVWNLNAVISEMEPMLTRLISEDIQLITSLAPDIGGVMVDRGQVEQILMNLVVNARDAMPDGGKLWLNTWSESHAGAASPAGFDTIVGSCVALTVRDTGVGMTPDVCAEIFDPFFTTKEVGKGTGLGLSMVHGIVKQSGGNISVHSEPGKGSTFRILFPQVSGSVLAEREADEHEPNEREPNATRPAASQRGHETILLVEDDTRVREFARRALESHGYRVIEAHNGQAALQALAKSPLHVDLVVTDLVMPDMGGRALVAQLRQKWPALPVVYVSGYTEGLSAERGSNPEDTRLLHKPFTPAELMRVIRELLDI
jgi:PAS domain S-box-containing protein